MCMNDNGGIKTTNEAYGKLLRQTMVYIGKESGCNLFLKTQTDIYVPLLSKDIEKYV